MECDSWKYMEKCLFEGMDMSNEYLASSHLQDLQQVVQSIISENDVFGKSRAMRMVEKLWTEETKALLLTAVQFAAQGCAEFRQGNKYTVSETFSLSKSTVISCRIRLKPGLKM